MPSAVAIASKYLFLTTLIYAARNFDVTSATARETEDPLSFLEGFVEGDFRVRKAVVKRSVGDVSVDKRVPQYMMDLYERLANRKLKIKFDIVRSIPCEDVSEIKELHSSWSKSSNFYKFIFNISNFPHSEYVLLAQLRIRAIQPLEEEKFDTMRLGIFSLHENPPSLLSSRDFNPNTESLYTLDITKMFQKALFSYEKLLILVLTIPDGLKDFLILDSLSTDGPQLLVMSKTEVQQEVHEDNIPTRMRRSLNKHNVKPKRNKVHKRNNSSKALRQSEDEKHSSNIVEDLEPIRKGKLRMKKPRCHMKSMIVNFADINYWWIIAPKKYDAIQCSGRCSIPMSVPPTMHARIQTMMHNVHPENVSRACCVPTKLSSIMVLYKDDKNTVFTKHYDEMRVLECGCR